MRGRWRSSRWPAWSSGWRRPGGARARRRAGGSGRLAAAAAHLHVPGAARRGGRLRSDVPALSRPAASLLLVAALPLGLRLFGAARGAGQRYVGLRAHRADAAHAVHGDRVCRAAPSRLCRALPPDEGAHIDSHPGSRYFVQSIEYESAHRALVRTAISTARHRLAVKFWRGASPRHPVRLGPRVSRLHLAALRRPAGLLHDVGSMSP